MQRSGFLRPAAGIAAVAVIAGALTGCSQDAETSPEGVITIFAPQWPDADLDESAFTKVLEEKFDVDLQFETTTGDGAAAAEKRQISLASGEYPDAYMLVPWVNQFSRDELTRLGDQGVIVPLDDLIADHAPNITAAFEKVPEYEQTAVSPEGTIWGLPQWNDCFHCSYGAKLWMNSDWLDAVGLDRPTTPEELRTVLEAFKTQDPNGNGEDDEIPLLGSTGTPILTYLMNPFVSVAGTDTTGGQPVSLGLDGDDVVVQATKEGWREGLAYINSLWEDGLIDEESFTQNTDALKTKGEHPDDVIAGSFTGLVPTILTGFEMEDGRNYRYDAVPPLAGPNGAVTPRASSSLPGASFAITNRASEAKQQKLIEIMDYLFSYEGHLLGEFGTEGVNWDRPADGDVALDETMEPLFKTLTPAEGEGVNNGWGALAQYFSDAEFRGGQVVPTDIHDQAGYERRLFEATELYEGHEADDLFPYWETWVTGDAASELSTAQTNVETFIAQASAEFIAGIRDIDDDAAWAEFQQGLTDNGADRYTELYQEAWDASQG